MNTLTVKTLKPRNPWVAASLRRKAGAHRKSGAAMRRQSQVSLQRELTEWRRERRSP